MDGADEGRKHRILKELSGYMGRKMTDEQMRFYQKNLAEIPAEFLANTCGNYMMENPPGVPSRFPTVFDLKKSWNAVKDVGQNHASDFRRSPCVDCMGEGMLWYRVQDDRSVSGVYERCCKCDNCTNYRQHGPMPRLKFMRKRDLEAMGYETYPYTRKSGPKKGSPLEGWEDYSMKDMNDTINRREK